MKLGDDFELLSVLEKHGQPVSGLALILLAKSVVGSVYMGLERLHALGFVEVTESPAAIPGQVIRLWSITDAGRALATKAATQ